MNDIRVSARVEWDQHYREGIEAHRRQNEVITHDFARFLPNKSLIRIALSESRSTLEIGCGTGELSGWIAQTFGSTVTGIDLSEIVIQYAAGQNRRRCQFRAADYRDLLPAGQHYDLLVSFNVLEHYADYATVLREWLEIAPLVLMIVPYKEARRTGEYTDGGLRHISSFDEQALSAFKILEAFTFATDGWRCGKDPLKWAVLVGRDQPMENDYDRPINRADWAMPKPFGFSGCFRLRNESEFMETAIRSHLPWLDEAVLCIQPSDDNTYEIAYRLAAQEPKVKVYEYPYIVDWTGSKGFYEKNPETPGHLVHMSNWALTRCKYSWIVKTEGDVIALSTFGKIIEAVKAAPNKPVYYGRVILNLAGENCDLISLQHPRNAGWDEAVFPNAPKYGFERSGKFGAVPLHDPKVCMGWSALHVKRCKRKNLDNKSETWLPLTRENVRKALKDHNQANLYSAKDDPLGEDCIYERDWIDYFLEHRP